MTVKQQKRFFFPAWGQACRALGWRMFQGRLEMNVNTLNEFGCKVHAAAVQRAGSAHRAATLDDLRHGCYIVALGHDRDTLKLDNREVDAVTSLFKLLADETDIAAGMKLANPDIGERERLVRKIHALKIPDAIIIGVCRKSFSPVFNDPWFKDLPILNLRALVGILLEISERKKESFNAEVS